MTDAAISAVVIRLRAMFSCTGCGVVTGVLVGWFPTAQQDRGRRDVP